MVIDHSTAIVFGGSSGLGAACVDALQDAGARGVVADLNPPDKPELDFCATDVTDESSVAGAIARADDADRPLRVVVVCAGVLHAERIAGRDGPADVQSFRHVVDVNLVGTFNVLRLAAHRLQSHRPDEEGQRGVIVMTSSIAASEGQIGQAAYAASKGGIASMTLPAARELGPFGIRVVTIAPGAFSTPMMQRLPPPALQQIESETVFPNRLGHPREFAQLVVQVVANDMINGTVIRLDGGMRLS